MSRQALLSWTGGYDELPTRDAPLPLHTHKTTDDLTSWQRKTGFSAEPSLALFLALPRQDQATALLGNSLHLASHYSDSKCLSCSAFRLFS